MNLNSINGMGAIKFPSNGGFGSGDIPLSNKIFKVYTYDEYIKSLDSENEEESEEILEKSLMDDLKSKDKKRSAQQQIIDYQKEQREKLKLWYVQRKTYYIEKIKTAKTATERKLLKNNWNIEVSKKKKKYIETINKHRAKKSKQLNSK